MSMPARLASLGALLLAYAAMVAWLTWPLCMHLATHLADTSIACRIDTLYMTWALAFESHTLAAGRFDFADANIFYPAHGTLFYGPTGFGALPYFLPVFLSTGNPTVAINLTCFGGIVLTAWTLHLVAARWTRTQFAGFAAAMTFLTNPWVIWRFIPSAPSYAVLMYFPLIAFLAAAPAARFTQALRLLPLIVLQSLTDVAYIAPAVFAPLALLALIRLARVQTRAAGVRLIAVLVLAAVTLAPVYAAYIAVWAKGLEPVGQTWWRAPAEPTELPWGPFVGGPTAVALPVAALVIAGAVAFVVRARRSDSAGVRCAWAHAALWSGVGLYISLTPTVRAGGALLGLPTVASFFGTVRTPERLGVAALIGTALLAGLAFAECLRWLPARGRLTGLAARVFATAVLAAALYHGYTAADGVESVYPLNLAIPPRPESHVMNVLRRPGGPLLELPASFPPQAADAYGAVEVPVLADAAAMYRSIYHWRPLLNGYGSYWPRGYVERMALAQQLPDPAALAALRRQTGLELILVHVDAYAQWHDFVCQVPHPGCSRDPGLPKRAWRAALTGRRDLWLEASERQMSELLFRVVEVP